jgi:predicted Rossmann fold flavoprotein
VSRQTYDVIVVGAGAAGMMAAGTCAEKGSRVLLVEQNRQTGRKIRITGKGRCNVTNNCSPQEVIANTPRGGKFLYGALSRFAPEDTMAFFEGLGVPLKTERGRRVFPQSDQAGDIAQALESFCKHAGVEFYQGKALEVLTENGAVIGLRVQGAIFSCKKLLLACGGASYPGTGSDGSGYKLAEKAGHSITAISPSLVPLTAEGEDCRDMMGLSLRNCGLKITRPGKKKPVYEDFGELLFTHFGLSGPVILSASAHLDPMEPGLYTVHLDLKPALSEQQLDARLLRDFEKNHNRFFENSLQELLPAKMIPVAVRRSGIPGETRCHSITREQRRELIHVLKDFTVVVRGFRPLSEAIVTRGGVSLKEVDAKTMGSKLVEGLYFAGELLDLDGYTGGYNLQIAFSTGHLAGESMAEE